MREGSSFPSGRMPAAGAGECPAVGQQWPPSPLGAARENPSNRVRWSWAVLGAAAVAVGSVTFMAVSGGAPPVFAPKRTISGLRVSQFVHDIGAAEKRHDDDWATKDKSRRRILGMVSLMTFPWGLCRRSRSGRSGCPGGGHRDAPDLCHRLLSTREAAWAAMDDAAQHQGLELLPLSLGDRSPHPSRSGNARPGCNRRYNQYFTHARQETWWRQRGQRPFLRLGWEFNGNWFRWSSGAMRPTRETSSHFGARSWTTMRAVPGEKFKFLWNPNAPSPTTYTPPTGVSRQRLPWTTSEPTSMTTSGERLSPLRRLGRIS